VDSAGNAGTYSSLKLDSEGNPCISYHVLYSKLKFACKRAGSWEIQVVKELWMAGLYTSLVLDDNDIPRISFYDGRSYDLSYAAASGQIFADLQVILMQFGLVIDEGKSILAV
jgi:hypothetical protein